MPVTQAEIAEINLDSLREVTYAIAVMVATTARIAEQNVEVREQNAVRALVVGNQEAAASLAVRLHDDRAAVVRRVAKEIFPRLLFTLTPLERTFVLCSHLVVACERLSRERLDEAQAKAAAASARGVLAAVAEMLPADRLSILQRTLTSEATSAEGQRRLISDLPFA